MLIDIFQLKSNLIEYNTIYWVQKKSNKLWFNIITIYQNITTTVCCNGVLYGGKQNASKNDLPSIIHSGSRIYSFRVMFCTELQWYLLEPSRITKPTENANIHRNRKLSFRAVKHWSQRFLGWFIATKCSLTYHAHLSDQSKRPDAP